MMKKKSTKELIQEVKEYKGDTPIIRELTPELADKIWKSIQKKRYDDKVSQDAVLHHLKQLKAQMGKEKKRAQTLEYSSAIEICMLIIDRKIAKIKGS